MEGSYPAIAFGWFYREGGNIYAEITNQINKPIIFCGAYLTDLSSTSNNASIEILGSGLPIVIPSTKVFESDVARTSIEFSSNLQKHNLSSQAKINICFETQELKPNRKIIELDWGPPPRNAIGMRPFLGKKFDILMTKHPYLEFVGDNHIAFRPGVWEIKESIIIPRHLHLSAQPNSVLKLYPNVSIIAYGDMSFIGSEDKPILIKSIDSNAKGGGAAVLGFGTNKVIWRHVSVDSMRSPRVDGWTTTGAVTFYKSLISMEHVRFSNIDAEDALNIVQSKFSMRSVNFEKIQSDAFDCDYCIGDISDASFSSVGGDGLDTSGALVSITKSSFSNIGDKALSIGERSNVEARDILINNVRIGIASKDASQTLVDKITIEAAKVVGIIAYAKKSEYGSSGSVIAKNVKVIGTFPAAKAQDKGGVILNGEKIGPDEIDVKKLNSLVLSP